LRGSQTPPRRGSYPNPSAVTADAESALERLPKVSGSAELSITQELRQALEAADKERERLKDEYVSVEHLVIALLDEGTGTAAGRLLRAEGLTDFMVQAGGDLYVAGSKGPTPWKVGVRDPRGGPDSIIAAMPIRAGEGARPEVALFTLRAA